jgi:hypothetical protein
MKKVKLKYRTLSVRQQWDKEEEFDFNRSEFIKKRGGACKCSQKRLVFWQKICYL